MARLTNDKARLGILGRVSRRVCDLFRKATDSAAAMASLLVGYSPDRPFRLEDYPALQREVDAMLRELRAELAIEVESGIADSAALADVRNNAMVLSAFGAKDADALPELVRRRYLTDPDGSAAVAFARRRAAGMNLSGRVWAFSKGYRSELEAALAVSLKDGVPAASLAGRLKKYLNEPERLYRRVRDDQGVLHLSKAAKLYKPGRGIYRSSYKNALRLAVTETNIAYHAADHERWQRLDFVVGIEVRLSGNHTTEDNKGRPRPLTDICDELQGRYPKDFKFTGWHPFCRCTAVPILKTPDEMAEDTQRIMDGDEPMPPDESANAVEVLPDGFQKWTQENAGRIADAYDNGKPPYFLKDNFGSASEVADLGRWRVADEGSEIETELSRLRELASPFVENPLNGVAFADITGGLVNMALEGFTKAVNTYYAVRTNAEKVAILKGIVDSQPFKKLGYHSTDTNSVYGINLQQYDRKLAEKEMPKNLAIAKKALQNGYDVYLLSNPGSTKSADFIMKDGKKLYYVEGKRMDGKNSLDHLLAKGASQAERVAVDVVGNFSTRYVSSQLSKAFEGNETLSEVWLFKRSRLIRVTRADIKSKGFDKKFKERWEQRK